MVTRGDQVPSDPGRVAGSLKLLQCSRTKLDVRTIISEKPLNLGASYISVNVNERRDQTWLGLGKQKFFEEEGKVEVTGKKQLADETGL